MRKKTEDIFPAPIRDLPEAHVLIEGIKAYLSQSDGHQILFMEFAEDASLPEHSHGAHAGFVLEGKIELVIEGQRLTCSKGERYFIPAGARHSAMVYKGYSDISFFAEPDRYTPKK